MNFKQYAIVSRETMNLKETYKIDMYHAASGIVTEIDELENATTEHNRKEELGDIFWYLALMHKNIDFNFSLGYVEFEDKSILTLKLRKAGINLLDVIKSHVQYDRKNRDSIKVYCEEISYLLVEYITMHEYDLEDIFEINVNKLQLKRYKKGFTQDEANNRNLEEEEKALKGEV